MLTLALVLMSYLKPTRCLKFHNSAWLRGWPQAPHCQHSPFSFLSPQQGLSYCRWLALFKTHSYKLVVNCVKSLPVKCLRNKRAQLSLVGGIHQCTSEHILRDTENSYVRNSDISKGFIIRAWFSFHFPCIPHMLTLALFSPSKHSVEWETSLKYTKQD